MDWSGYVQLTLRECVAVADDLLILRVESPEAIDFTPGQYATLGVHDEATDRPLLRAYSVVATPGDRMLEFFVELVPDGALTPRLWALESGDRLWMRKKIVGRFVRDTDRQHHVMAATVTGVGPYVSIARQLAAEAAEGITPPQLLIIHGGSRSWELGTYRDELHAMSTRYDWVSYVPTVSRPWEDAEWTGERGRVGDVLRKHWDAARFPLEDTAVYACGHPKMVQHVEALARRAGLPEAAFYEEKYFVERRTT
ncbi:FAD-binding oxidoreductase [Salisaeta longa]|uniref:FAD-binding oxidoreductase n=1 Tax=Salisaeta longa TaxID=503170 RepID=UPI0003B3AA80|nr:FAD-binding oxidoreductase [Salisaeta longa]